MKLLISEVETDDDIMIPAAQSYLVQVTDELRGKVELLRKAVEETDALSIDSLFSDGYWSSLAADTHEDGFEQKGDTTATLNVARSSRTTVELQILTVRRSGFRFKGVPKGASSQQTMYSELFGFEVLGL